MIEIGSFVKPSIKSEIVYSAKDYIIKTDKGSFYDTMSGLWCTPLGYSDSGLKNTITNQLHILPYYNNYFETQCDITERYAKNLCNATKMDRVYFSLSGAGAVETAIKVAHNNRPTGKCCVFKKSYHGATILSGYTSDYNLENYHKLKSPIEVHYYEDEMDLNEMSFVLLEPVICAGGIHKHDNKVWENLSKYQKNGGIIILDEIVTGFGKTGKLFAKEWTPINPDIVLLGKAITNGYIPFAATLINENILSTKSFEHGFTCSGHPLGAAAGEYVLQKLLKYDFNFEEYELDNHTQVGCMGAFQFNSIKESTKYKKEMKKLGWILEYSSSDLTRIVYCLPYILPNELKEKFYNDSKLQIARI